ncbi:MAG: NAD(P)-dependent oxidoreductase [Oscillospiraceae bacterium]|jgi:nucleoside-diphosphate-sugar epimerase|nr:NAD(P)-dependent oxidoreductase [Oscillospiraceae bacterium]
MDILVGSTGFVGSNLALQHSFSGCFHSSDIAQAYGLEPDLCVYSGVRAEKFLANKNPAEDKAHIAAAIENIKRIRPKTLVLISTIDVFKNPNGANEASPVDIEGLHPYGLNRRRLEQWAEENIEDVHIIRLPGLLGNGIKKNFIHDMLYPLPAMLNTAKLEELSAKEGIISEYYTDQNNGFYKLDDSGRASSELAAAFKRIGFSALNFTDSRAVFQFYNLDYIWEHIQIVLKNNIKLMHMAVEPISVGEIYRASTGVDFVNEIAPSPPCYDFYTKYASIFGGEGEYIFNKERVLADILRFLEGER